MTERAGNFAGPFPLYALYVVIKYPLNKTHETRYRSYDRRPV